MTIPPSIRIRDLSKCYKLGLTHAGSIRELVHGWTSKLLRKPDAQTQLASDADEFTSANGSKSNRDFWALRNINLDIAEGEILGLIGRNGAGKSTLLKILSKITYPTEGHAELHGRVSSLLEVGTGFHPELTGRENVFMNGTILGMKRADIRKQFDDIVDFSGVKPFIDTPVKRYSSGMTVRLGFAVAAHLQPDILIVDEVLAVGDFDFQRQCLGKMEEASQAGRTVLFVSHNMGAIRALCSRAVHLEAGRLVDDGVPDTVIDRYLQATGSSSAIELPPDNQRDGTGEARFREVKSSDASKQPNATFLMCQTVALHLSVEVFQRVENAHFQVFLTGSDGTVVTCSETTSRPYQPTTLEVGSATIHTEIDARLLPGEYRINAVILRGNGATIDAIDNAMRFSVDRAGTETGEFFRWNNVSGYVRPATVWKVSQTAKQGAIHTDNSHMS